MRFSGSSVPLLLTLDSGQEKDDRLLEVVTGREGSCLFILCIVFDYVYSNMQLNAFNTLNSFFYTVDTQSTY